MSENKSLIEMARDYAMARNIYETFNEEEYLVKLDELAEEMYLKEDGIKYIYDQHTKEIDLFKDRITKMQQYVKALERGQERIKQYVIDQFSMTNMLPNQSVFLPIKISQSAGSVQIDDPSLIPFEYIRIKQIQEPDKAAISKALKNGEKVPGCRLVFNDYVRGIK